MNHSTTTKVLSAAELAAQIKQRASELGFAACGITGAEPPATHEKFLAWLQAGHHASMQWMAREDAVAKRGDLQQVLPGCKSVVCVAMHYRTDADWDQSTLGNVARYARGLDYHDFMTPRVRELLAWIGEQTPCNGRVYVDTGPLLERDLARRAGIGWVGKNSMLMSRELGSYFLLGEILLDIALPPDAPYEANFCGTCTRCMDACPTDALEQPFVLNANKCISFHTIENRKRIPVELRENFGDWVYGCDICQQVCPWNQKSTFRSNEPELWQREEFPTLQEWLSLPQSEFSRRLKGSPLKRPKRRGLKRNALAVLKNRKRARQTK